ncbi:phosphotransferase [Actinomadura hibisca]|uniref:phosphotransferase n=1 Tax=Actinomadura hibisca TaxID=68565 RepID=UPI000831909C|nr:phosphotransferase [Actinomadura hibisca]
MGGREWDAEITVDAAGAATLFGGRFGRVRPLATGWDNTVFLADDAWILRFPRRRIAVAGVEREIAVLPRLAGRLPLPIPVPEVVGEPSERFPWPFWAARIVPGRELVETELPDGERGPLAADAGAFVRALHACTLDAELPHDPFKRGDPAVRAPLARERLARLEGWGPVPDVMDLLAEGERLGAGNGPSVVTHGDLHVRHLLVRPDGRAAGVIDWGDLCLADPAVDLSLAYAAFRDDDRAAFLDAYGPVPSGTELRARVLAIFLSVALAEYALDTGRAALHAEAVAGLRRAAS